MSNSNPQLKQYIRENLMNMYLELQESNKARRALIRAKKAALGNVGGEGDVNATESGGRSDTPSRFGDTFAKRNFRRDQKSTPGPTVSSPAMIKAQTKNNDMLSSASAITSARKNAALAGQNVVLAGQNAALTSSAIGSARGQDILARVAAKMGDQNAATMADNTALAGENATLTGQNAALMAKPWEKWKAGVGKLDNSLLGNSPASGGGPPSKGLLGSGGNVGMGAKLAVGGVAAGLQGLSSASTEWEENKNKGMGSGENLAKTAVRGTAGAVGAGVGATVLGGLGQALGSRIPGIGGAIGFALGSAVGGLGGGYVADKAADFVTNVGDDDEGIKDFQADRKIRGIERQDKIDQAKQAIADRRLRKSGDTTLSPLSSGQQQQSLTVNGQAAGGNQYFPGGNVSITSTNSQSMRR